MIVLIAVTEKQVIISDAFNTAPITGRQAIFAKVSAPTETRLDVEVVGVYTNLETANAARQAHAQAHPGRRYVQKVATLDDRLPEPPESPKCVKCGIVTGGHSFCPACQQKHFEECVDRDPLGGQGDRVPMVRTSFGKESVLLNSGA